MTNLDPLHHPADHGVDLAEVSSLGLLRLYADILTTLNKRAVVRSRNAPSGDLSEYLTAAVYSGVLANQSKASWDVQTADGKLLQVKCRVLEPGKPTGNYSPFRSFEFHAGVFIHFDALTYDIISAYEAPVETIRALTTDDTHVGVKARRLTVRNLLKAANLATQAQDDGGPPSPYVNRTPEFAAQMLLLASHR